MNVDDIRTYCLQQKAVTESEPFGEGVLVFKVVDKMFACISISDSRVSLKCDPDKAIELRDRYVDIVIPGYHMNKRMWNTIIPETLSETLIKEWVDHSYKLVVAKLTKKQREEIGEE